MAEKKRTTRIGVWYAEVSTGWNTSHILFRERNGDDEIKQVILSICSPSELGYVRDQLDKIEAEWKRQIASLSA